MKSLKKALDILELFLDIDGEVRLSDLAKSSGLNKATVNRIVSVLVNRGYLRQPEKRGKYSLGTKFLDFSGLIKKRSKIRDTAIPYLIRLSQLVKESVMLAVWQGGRAVYSETIHADYPLRIIPDEGTKVPLYNTGVGKIFLANMTPQEQEIYLSTTPLQAYTPNTITGHEQLKKHLAMIVKEGIAFDDEEYYIGVRNVAAAIKDGEGKVVASVGVLGPSIRLSRSRMKEIAPEVKKCAMEISKALGFKGK